MRGYDDMEGLASYLDEFSYGDALAATVVPASSGLTKLSVLDAQQVMAANGVTKSPSGALLTAGGAGLYGPNTRAAWQKLAISKGLNPAFDRAGPQEAWVNPTTVQNLRPAYTETVPAWSAASPTQASTPAALPSGTPNAPGTVRRPVLDLQRLLNRLGWTTAQVDPDGKFGTITRGAWAQSATKRGLNPLFERIDGYNATVDQKALTALEAVAKSTPQPKALVPSIPKTTTTAPRAGTVERPVLELQELLYGVGWTAKKLTKDGTYGPQTKGAWAFSAKLRGLPQTFERVDGKTARVDQATYAKIQADGGGAKPSEPSTPDKPTVVDKPGLPAGAVSVAVFEAQIILTKLGLKGNDGKPLVTDGDFGPNTKGAWERGAKARKLNAGVTRLDGKTMAVSADTLARLKAEADKPPAPDPTKPVKLPAFAGVPVAVFEAQQILTALGLKGDDGKPLVTDGDFGPNTSGAWRRAAKARKLNADVARLNGKTMSVNADTYARLKDEATRAPAPDPTKPAPTPAGGINISVKEGQGIVRKLGSKGNISDDKWGPDTKKAWETQAAKRKLNPGVSRVDGKTMAVNSATYEALKAAAGGGMPPIGGDCGSLGPGYSTKCEGKTYEECMAIVPKAPPGATFTVMSQAQHQEFCKKAYGRTDVPGKKTPKKPTGDAEVDAVVKISTVPTPVLALQHTLMVTGKYSKVGASGTWDDATRAAYFDLFQTPPTLREIVVRALPRLLSADARTILLPAAQGKVVAKGEQLWKEKNSGPEGPPIGGSCFSRGGDLRGCLQGKINAGEQLDPQEFEQAQKFGLFAPQKPDEPIPPPPPYRPDEPIPPPPPYRPDEPIPPPPPYRPDEPIPPVPPPVPDEGGMGAGAIFLGLLGAGGLALAFSKSKSPMSAPRAPMPKFKAKAKGKSSVRR